MSLMLFVLNFACWTGLHYMHQRTLVADSSYPVVKPPSSVSIVIPAYNEEAFIERVLLCVESQNVVLEHPELFEVIVVDNGSADRTVELAEEYAKVTVEEQRGVFYARHRGIMEANGELIVFLDADMVVPPNFLNLLLRHFHNEEIVAVGGGFLLIGGKLRNILPVYNNQLNSLVTKNFNLGVMAFRKEAYYRMGGFDFSLSQFTRSAERETSVMGDFKSVGKVVWDTEANVWVEPRIEYCMWYSHGQTCDSAYCRFCREREAGQRF